MVPILRWSFRKPRGTRCVPASPLCTCVDKVKCGLFSNSCISSGGGSSRLAEGLFLDFKTAAGKHGLGIRGSSTRRLQANGGTEQYSIKAAAAAVTTTGYIPVCVPLAEIYKTQSVSPFILDSEGPQLAQSGDPRHTRSGPLLKINCLPAYRQLQTSLRSGEEITVSFGAIPNPYYQLTKFDVLYPLICRRPWVRTSFLLAFAKLLLPFCCLQQQGRSAPQLTGLEWRGADHRACCAPLHRLCALQRLARKAGEEDGDDALGPDDGQDDARRAEQQQHAHPDAAQRWPRQHQAPETVQGHLQLKRYTKVCSAVQYGGQSGSAEHSVKGLTLLLSAQRAWLH